MIYDIFSYNGEADLLEIRLNILNDFVDQFIICEAPTTFSGKPKPLYYLQQEERYAKWKDKIKYYPINENYSPEEIALAENSPNTKGAEHWKHEFLQKESIKKALTHLKDDDICFIGDVDELWQMPEMVASPRKLKLQVYTYWLNNRSSEEFWGTLVSHYHYLKNACLNHLRSDNSLRTQDYFGWHFTSMGGYEEVKRKLTDSYTRESYWTPEVESNLEQNLKENKDFLGRNFTYILDERDLPKYILDNKLRYAHLWKS
jgi:beta-1,4-mannosyl-glycoprotein beta-1,4-N-acetylglucosaminyltransferase